MSKKSLFLVSALSILATACGEQASYDSQAPGVHVNQGKATVIEAAKSGAVEALNTCVDVYCDGEKAGQACGSTTEVIIDRAIALCGVQAT